MYQAPLLHRVFFNGITVISVRIYIEGLQPDHWANWSQWVVVFVVRQVFVGRMIGRLVERRGGRDGGRIRSDLHDALDARPLRSFLWLDIGSRVEFMFIG